MVPRPGAGGGANDIGTGTTGAGDTVPGLRPGITRGGSDVAPGNGGSGVPFAVTGGATGGAVPVSPPGGVGTTGGGAAIAAFSVGPTGAGIVLGMLGAGGFFGPKMRDSTPVRLLESEVSGCCAELAVFGMPGGAVLSLSRSPKMRPRIGRFSFSFDVSGMLPVIGGVSGSLGRCFALGGSGALGASFGAPGTPGDAGGVSPGLSTSVIVSPVLVSLSSERYIPSGCFSDFMTLNWRSPLPSMFREMTVPTFGGPSPSPRPVAIPTVTVAPARAAHIHRLLNHRVMAICLRAVPQTPSVALQSIRACLWNRLTWIRRFTRIRRPWRK